MQEGCAHLLEELKSFQPDLIIGMGELALRWLKDNPGSFDDERGAPFENKQTGTLTLCTYHPRQLFIQYPLTVIARADFEKAFRYSKENFSLSKLPKLTIDFSLPFTETLSQLHHILKHCDNLSVDIETLYGAPRMTCIGIGYSEKDALVIPFLNKGKPVWTLSEETEIIQLLGRVLTVKRLLGQNAVHFDHQVLHRGYGINANFVEDSMYAQWEVSPEHPKSLGFINSIYSDNPYWKSDLKAARSGKIPHWKEFEYNGRDCIYTDQNFQCIQGELDQMPKSCKEHYHFNILVSRAYQYMTLRGVPFDKAKADLRLKDLNKRADELQTELYKEIGHDLNVNSPAQMKNFLYKELGLPPKYKWAKNKQSGEREEKLTADFLNLLYLARQFPDLKPLQITAEFRKLRKRISFLQLIVPNKKGFVSWDFNCVGTKTGRPSSYKPISGHGCQGQNVDRRDRDLFCGGEDMFWLKADLEGADSWTQAAQLAMLGHTILMDDLLAGLKPALVITIAELFGHHLLKESQEVILSYKARAKAEIKKQETSLGKGRTIYDVNKIVSHGSAYGMKKQMMHTNVFKKTEGDLFIPPNECERIQKLIFARYPFPDLHDFMRSRMNSKPYLDNAGGTRRQFYGRKDDATLREMLANDPQAHTSFVTNTILKKAFYDKKNRHPNSSKPIMEPVNQVHDEVNFVFPQEKLNFVTDLFNEYKDVPISYWDQDFTIPWEAEYGHNWGECKEDLLSL